MFCLISTHISSFQRELYPLASLKCFRESGKSKLWDYHSKITKFAPRTRTLFLKIFFCVEYRTFTSHLVFFTHHTSYQRPTLLSHAKHLLATSHPDLASPQPTLSCDTLVGNVAPYSYQSRTLVSNVAPKLANVAP